MRRELESYRMLLPREGVLTASVMIQSGRPELGAHLGASLRRGVAGVALDVDGHTSVASSLESDPDDGPLHYVGFRLSCSAEQAIVRGRPVWLRLELPGSAVHQLMPAVVRDELAATLKAARFSSEHEATLHRLQGHMAS